MRDALQVRKAAVLGAGVMGAQIAAHLVNADVATVLFELPAEGEDRSANARKAIQALRKQDPSPLASKGRADLLKAANYDTDLQQLQDCDLVIEAIAERMDWKHDLYAKVAPHLGDNTILASNTSGLGIARLAEALPAQLRDRFCGIHFFNPPRYMHLVEIISSSETRPEVLNGLETFLVRRLGKGVIRAKDTPNFVANRMGVFSIMATIHHAKRLGLPFDVVDALTGKRIGRPKSATFRTADVVGLDTLAHVIRGSEAVLREDPWNRYYQVPAWLESLVEQGALGQKTRRGVYRKDGKQIMVLEPAEGDYRPSAGELSEEVAGILKNRDWGARMVALRSSDDPQAQFLWAVHRDVFHYAAVNLGEIADNARDLDLAVRWGFGWKQGPFEIWQMAGWRQVSDWIREDISAGRTMADVPLPDWVDEVDGVHRQEGSWSAAASGWRARSDLPVYRRQLFPDTVVGEAAADIGTTVFETENGVRLWHRGDDIAIVSITSKMHAIGDEVLDGLLESVEIAERDFAGLVIWQPKEPFSVGANLLQAIEIAQAKGFDAVEELVHKFQRATGRLRNSSVPVVGAARGLALGGGCEVLLHCDRVVAALESYIGLVEVGVGLIPAGGGCKERALRAAQQAPDDNLFPFVRQAFETIAMGKVAKSAEEAKELGLLRDSDIIVFNPHEVLHVAVEQARAMAEAGYRPPLPRKVPVLGRPGVATLEAAMVNMREGGFISEHDYLIGRKVALALCGGDVDPGTLVDEEWLLVQERKAFVELAQMPKTQERIVHMLQTGKPLRN